MATNFNACVAHDYPCNVSNKYSDPCDCKRYYMCEHITKIILRNCSDGTLFNHESGICEREEDVASTQLCEPNAPWVRCRDVDSNADIPSLKERCTGISPTQGTTPTIFGPTEAQADPGVNGGAIAGAVIAVLLAIAIFVIIFIVFKKRRKPASSPSLTLKTQVCATPKYDNQDETYAEINDDMVHIYKDFMQRGPGSSPSVPDRPAIIPSPTPNITQDINRVKGRHDHGKVSYEIPVYTPLIDDVLQGSVSDSHVPPTSGSLKAEEFECVSSSGLEESTPEVPSSKPYTPISEYMVDPNSNSSSSSAEGILHLNDDDYQVPRPIPVYHELDPDFNIVS